MHPCSREALCPVAVGPRPGDNERTGTHIGQEWWQSHGSHGVCFSQLQGTRQRPHHTHQTPTLGALNRLLGGRGDTRPPLHRLLHGFCHFAFCTIRQNVTFSFCNESKLMTQEVTEQEAHRHLQSRCFSRHTEGVRPEPWAGAGAGGCTQTEHDVFYYVTQDTGQR